MIYFDNASTSWPKPSALLEEMQIYLREIGVNPSRGNYSRATFAEAFINKTRSVLSSLFNIKNPRHLSFTLNATHSINIVLKGLLKAGDHVLISNFEHNAVVRPLEKLVKTHGVSYSIYESNSEGFFDLKKIESLITENTKLIICNHASNVIGVISPISDIGKIAQKHGLLYLVDCAQTAGIIEIDVENDQIDFLAGTSHKTLLGPPGAGFLYVKDPSKLETLYEGGSGYNSLSKKHPEITPLKFEAGTLNYMGIAGLYGSLKFLEAKGLKEIYKLEMKLTQYLLENLSQIEYVKIYGTDKMDFKIPLVSFNLKSQYSSETSYILDKKYSISVRGGIQCAPLIHKTINTLPHGTTRISFGPHNSLEEVDVFIKAMKEIKS